MTLLILGVLSWWVVHLFPIYAAPKRDVLAARFGEVAYKVAYAILTLVTVALMVKGYQAAPYIEVWTPPPFLAHINNLLMLVAIAFYIAGGIPSPVRRWVRHPQFTGTKVWALAHLLVNGDLASVILFGGLLGWAVVALIGTNRRDGPRGEKPKVSKIGTPLHILASLAVFYIIAYIHGSILGVWPFPGGA